MNPFTKRVIAIIQAIPEGRVMTYGQIAEQAGSRRAARQVVRILHSLSRLHELPWHRVINSRGEIAVKDEEHRFLQTVYLRDEGVELQEGGTIDLLKYRFIPGDEEERS